MRRAVPPPSNLVSTRPRPNPAVKGTLDRFRTPMPTLLSSFDRRRALATLLWPLLGAMLASCTQSTSASLWVEDAVSVSSMQLLTGTLVDLGWAETEHSQSGDVIYRHPSQPSAFVVREPRINQSVKLTFVVAGRSTFTHSDVAAYQRLNQALVQAFGPTHVRAEQMHVSA